MIYCNYELRSFPDDQFVHGVHEVEPEAHTVLGYKLGRKPFVVLLGLVGHFNELDIDARSRAPEVYARTLTTETVAGGEGSERTVVVKLFSDYKGRIASASKDEKAAIDAFFHVGEDERR